MVANENTVSVIKMEKYIQEVLAGTDSVVASLSVSPYILFPSVPAVSYVSQCVNDSPVVSSEQCYICHAQIAFYSFVSTHVLVLYTVLGRISTH